MTDPLFDTTESSRELFKQFSKEAHGFSAETAIDAAANIIINALRQACATRSEAEQGFDEVFGKMKQVLVNHYDSLGRKRGVFPFNQTIHIPFIGNKSEFPS